MTGSVGPAGLPASRVTRSSGQLVERVTGIEPAWPAWKAGALPLRYTREQLVQSSQTLRLQCCAIVGEIVDANRLPVGAPTSWPTTCPSSGLRKQVWLSLLRSS